MHSRHADSGHVRTSTYDGHVVATTTVLKASTSRVLHTHFHICSRHNENTHLMQNKYTNNLNSYLTLSAIRERACDATSLCLICLDRYLTLSAQTHEV